MNINQYAPKQVYENINSILNDFKLQSDILHNTISNLDLKCTNYQIISETEIDGLVDNIRNYSLIKESCLEQSSKILSIENISSIEDLSSKVKKHEESSLSIMNDILYYAYEFLKIRSSNIITEGLLQDHREKLNSIINSMMNEFVDIEDVSKQLEPYKIALMYIIKQILDLTPYAELINNTFGAILFYNIVSGNNIEYNPNSSQDISERIEISPQYNDNSNILEELNLFNQNDNTTIESIIDFEIPIIAEVKEVVEFETPIVDEIQDSNIIEEESNINEDSNTIESTPDIQNENIEEEVISKEFQSNEVEDKDINTDIEECISTEDTTIQEMFETPQESEEESNSAEIEEVEEIDDTTNLIKENEEVEYFENLSNLISAKYDENKYIYNAQTTFDETRSMEIFFNYVNIKQFACASMLLKEYSKRSNIFDTLYTQYGLAIGDPCINSDYSISFMNIVNDDIHSWLELSAIFRAMFTCKNKEVECYNFSAYINSLTQNIEDTILQYIPNFYDILEVFNSIDYNTNYLTGIKLFDESNSIVYSIKKKASDMLIYCENTIRPWNHKAMINATKTLFSSSGGYVYNLIKEVSLGNFYITDKIKSYCSRFADDDGRMLDGIYLNRTIEDYLHEQLSIANTKKNNYNSCDTDINIGYKQKFTNRFTNILQFLFNYIDEINAININCINETNVQKYRELKDTLITMLDNNHLELIKSANDTDISKGCRAGMICLAKTFKDIISYTNYENYRQNYFYCELLKTGYFMLDDMYIPYLNENISSIQGLETITRVSKHISELKYIDSWKTAIESNIKKLNVGNVKLILEYLKDTNQNIDEYKEYLERVDNIKYSIDDTFNNFNDSIQELYLMEVIPNKSVLNNILDMENIVRMAIYDTRNYGFYNMFLELLKEHTIRICEESYSLKSNILDYIGQNSGYDSDYYSSIAENMDTYKYCISDELISMYFNSIEYPKDNIDTSQIKQYDEIYSSFMEFCNKYASDLSSPNGYIFMNEFYNSTIKAIVTERFSGSYDCTKSDELIDTWVKGQSNDNVIYDILTNIGFGIESTIDLDIHTSKIVLSNSEKNNSQPYVIPEYIVFLNGIYNISQTDRNISSLNITQDTLIILDYALSNYEREHVLKNLNKISNGNRVILVDRCTIMYLTTIPISIRKLAFKVCSICDISNNVSCSSNFRTDYIQTFTKDSRCNLLLGREYFGKTYILNSVADILRINADNIVIFIDAFNDDFSNPDSISQECNSMGLKINPFDDWKKFETSMTRYLNKHPNKKVILLIDNFETHIQANANTNNDVTPIDIFKGLSNKFKNRFTFTVTTDICNEYISFAESNQLSYITLKPLSYYETANLFEGYLNGSRIFVQDKEVMNMLVSKAFGCPEMVRLISKQIILTVSQEKNLFKDSYLYNVNINMVNKALSNSEFINVISQVFLSTVIGGKEQYSMVVPIVYAIVYYLHEHPSESVFTITDIKNVLNIFDINESSILSISTALEELQTLGLICKFNDDEYFLAHEYYKNYLGNKEFAFDMLDYCTKIFAKEGIA